MNSEVPSVCQFAFYWFAIWVESSSLNGGSLFPCTFRKACSAEDRARKAASWEVWEVTECTSRYPLGGPTFSSSFYRLKRLLWDEIIDGAQRECQLPSPCLQASQVWQATKACPHIMHFSFPNLACLVYPPSHYQWIVKISKGPLFTKKYHSIMLQHFFIGLASFGLLPCIQVFGIQSLQSQCQFWEVQPSSLKISSV